MEKDTKEAKDFVKAWKKIVAKAWAHKDFKEKLLKHPKETLTAEGIKVPKEVEVVIHVGRKNRWDLYLPESPDLDVNQLGSMWGGVTWTISDLDAPAHDHCN